MMQNIKEQFKKIVEKAKTLLPSRRFGIVIFSFITLLVVGIIFILVANNLGAKSKVQKLAEFNAKKESLNQIKEQIMKDADEDGLPDWEEALWHTDINKKDTDGDGTPDGEEIKLKRDPSVAGPNDTLADAFKNASSTDDYFKNSKMRATDKVSQKIFYEYMQAKTRGEAIDSEKIGQLVRSSLTAMVASTTLKVYDLSKIKVKTDYTTTDIANYGNDLGATMKKYANDYSPGTEIFYLKDALESQDREKLKELDKVIKNYDLLIRDLLKISVPASASITHLELINLFSKAKTEIAGMLQFFDDPIIAAAAIKEYTANMQIVAKKINTLRDYFKNAQVTYSETDPAMFFISQAQ